MLHQPRKDHLVIISAFAQGPGFVVTDSARPWLVRRKEWLLALPNLCPAAKAQ